MRQAIGFAALLIIASASAGASAAPNVFWTFGFDLPLRGEQAPHFGAIAADGQLASIDGSGGGVASRLPAMVDGASDQGDTRLRAIVMVAAHSSRIPVSLP